MKCAAYMYLCIVLVLAIGFLRPSTSLADNGTTAHSGCPTGSKRDFGLGRCVQVTCGGSNDSTTAECRLNPGDVYVHHADEVQPADEPIVHVELPACKNITLRPSEFTLSADGSTLTATFGRATVVLDRFRLLSDRGNASSADICYPLSPQLLQCPLRKLHRSSYTLQPARALVNRFTNDTIGLRDYYTSPDSDDILACNGSVNDQRKLRCNYIIYKPDEYRFVDEGRRLWLLPTNSSIYRPEYTDMGNGSLSVCYPFSLPFTRCELWILELHEFRILPDHRLLDTAHDHVYNLDDYFIFADGRGVVCSVSSDSLKSNFDLYYVHAVLYLLSAVCLCVAFVIHLIVPSLNYHAKPLLCHMICMTVMYTALAVRKFLPNIDPQTCYGLFVATYYSAMASFFWLNVLSFDLWTIFANLQTTSSWLKCSCRPNVKRRFYYYSVYALGIPLLFCGAVILVDTDTHLQDALQLYPKIPAMCWFNERRSAYAFLYIPMITVLVVNLALFVSTVCNLRQASRGAEVVNKKLNKQLLIVCFKLFIIMGFCWIGEAIAWTSDANIAVYYVPDAINAVQGIIIFLIYICKPATYRLLRNKFCPKKDSDGKWTMDFNTSRGYSRKTSSSGLSMSDRDNSVRGSANRKPSSTADRDNSVRSASKRSATNGLRSTSHVGGGGGTSTFGDRSDTNSSLRSAEPAAAIQATHTDSTGSDVPITSV